jgi:hypothetical protein
MRVDAQAYMARQREAGRSHKEAMRCLKRHLSNVVYRQLVATREGRSWRLDNIEGLVRRPVSVERRVNVFCCSAFVPRPTATRHEGRTRSTLPRWRLRVRIPLGPQIRGEAIPLVRDIAWPAAMAEC